MNIITGYRGEPHITSNQNRDANRGSYGVGSYILNIGSKMAATIVSANEVRIADGALSMQGCVGNISTGSYEALAIDNGTQGMKRSDLIVCRYTRDTETNIESLELVVIKGTPASTNPSDPSYYTGSIQIGATPVDFPLYRVNINGITISSITKLAPGLRTQAESDSLLGGTNISGIGGGTVTGAISALNNKFVTPESLGIILASSSYTCIRGFAYRIGKMVFVSVVMKSSSQIPAGQGLFRLDYATNQSITPAISNSGAASVNWTLMQMMPTSGQFVGTARAEAEGHHYIASGSTVPAETDIYVIGSFICQ